MDKKWTFTTGSKIDMYLQRTKNDQDRNKKKDNQPNRKMSKRHEQALYK